MSLRDFWLSVRIGARMLAPTVSVDSPNLDARRLERGLRAADIWLTPASVAGFDEADFSFLPNAERTRLAEFVARFHSMASRVRSDGPATREQAEQARPLFLEIIRMLEFDRFADEEAYRIGKQIEARIAPERPPWLDRLRFETGTDAQGDRSLWIWAILQDEEAEGERGKRNATSVRRLLSETARAVAPDHWPYVRFQTVSEQADLPETVPA